MRKLIVSGICCSALICGTALAGSTSSSTPTLSQLLSGYYIGVQPGYAKLNYDRKWLTSQTGFTGVDKVTSNDYASRLFIGYSYNKFIAVELGYLFLQGIKFKNISPPGGVNDDINQQMVDLVGKATLPMGYIGLYVKGGGAYVHRNQLSVSGATYRANNKYIPVVGGGLSIFISQNVTVGGEYDYYVKNGDLPRTEFYGASIIYQFD